MNDSLPTWLETQFHTEKILKHSDRCTVLLLRHKQDRSRRICKRFVGDTAVYQLLTEISSPHLPRVEQVVTEEGIVTVLEEYIQGDTLAELLEIGPLSEARAREILLQLCAALEPLHRRGVVHRDIKPENVILRGNTAVLIDFDASRLSKAACSSDTQIMGTAGYAAPEQYGFAQTDARSDIYALGVLLNVLLTKQHPASCLPKGPLRSVIQKCIEVNADLRYEDASALAAALSAPLTVPRKHRWIGWLAGLAAAAGLLLASSMQPVVSTKITVPMPSPPYTEEYLDPDTVQVIYNGLVTGNIGPTAFTYDLDGDGTAEDYLFGITFYKPNLFFGDVIYDEIIGVNNDKDSPSRTVSPCVWGYNQAGELEVRSEFSNLLTKGDITVRNSDNPHAAAQVTNVPYGWRDSIAAEFTPAPLGTWIYTATAKLDEKTLTTRSATIIQLME